MNLMTRSTLGETSYVMSVRCPLGLNDAFCPGIYMGCPLLITHAKDIHEVKLGTVKTYSESGDQQRVITVCAVLSAFRPGLSGRENALPVIAAAEGNGKEGTQACHDRET